MAVSGQSNPKRNAGIYIGWVGKENLGDEALWQVCQSSFPLLHWTLWDELRYEYSAKRYLGNIRQEKNYILKALAEELRTFQKTRMLAHKLAHRWTSRGGGEIGLLGGGTLINREDTWLDAYKAIRKRTGRLLPVFGTGVANPSLWSSEPGWIDKRKEWVSLLSELPIIGVRGPLSKALLEEAGAKRVIVSGDPVVALHSPLVPLGRPEELGRTIRVGMNCGYSGRMWGKAKDVHETQARVVRELRQQNYDIELFSVIPTETEFCLEVARQSGLDVSKVKVLSSTEKFFDNVSQYDLIVAFKLHAGVMAGVANVPFVMLEYQPKCLDFAQSLEWERFTIRTSELTRNKLLDMVQDMAGSLMELRGELCQRMNRLAAQFQDYCKSIEPLLLPY